MRAAVDVVVVNWNGRHYLPRCLTALGVSTIPVRVTVVDNASEDGSAEYVRHEHSGVRLLELSENRGYAGGANAGLAAGEAPYAFILNPDLLVEPDHFARLRDRLESDRGIAAAQGKLYHVSREVFVSGDTPPASVLDSAGQRILPTRLAVDRGQGEPDDGRWDDEASVFSACGAGLFLRREALADLAQAGPWFDPAFFAYKEDVDLCWRLRLRGWDIRYVPDAVAHHVRTLPGGDRSAWRRVPLHARRHSWKNHYLLMMKNDRFKDVARSLPRLLAWELGRTGWALLRDPRVLRAWLDVARLAPHALAERRQGLGVAAERGVDLGPWFGRDAVSIGEGV